MALELVTGLEFEGSAATAGEFEGAAFFPQTSGSLYRLNFAGDTLVTGIDLTGAELDIDDFVMEWVCNHASGETARQTVWNAYIDGEVQAADSWWDFGYNTTTDPRISARINATTAAAANYGDLAIPDATDIYIQMVKEPAGRLICNAGTDDTYSDWTSDNTGAGLLGLLDTLQFGQKRGTTAGFVGWIDEVKLYDAGSGGTLAHHWKFTRSTPWINGATITDLVGDADGTLTIGSGTSTDIGGGPSIGGLYFNTGSASELLIDGEALQVDGETITV